MFHVGIDVHQKYSEICVVDDQGEVLERSRIRSTEAQFKLAFGHRSEIRVVLECSGSSSWVARVLSELGHDVTVVNPRRVRLIAESTLKTDRIDAEVLAQLSCFGRGLLRGVYQRSDTSNLLRTRLGTRAVLVRAKVSLTNSIRGTLRSAGYRIQGTTLGRFLGNLHQAPIPSDLRQALDPLVETLVEVAERIQKMTKELETEFRGDELLQRLQSVPGVGPIVSLAFVGWVDDPTRFSRSREVGNYAGLRPSMRSSGGVERRGRITREGDPEMRRLLVQSAHVLMRCGRDCALKQWAQQLAERAGKKKATVALARKLAILLHHLWVSGESFEPFPTKA